MEKKKPNYAHDFARPAKIGNDCRYFLNKDNY